MTLGVIMTTSMADDAIGQVKDSRLVDTPYGLVEQRLVSVESGTVVAIRRSTGSSLNPPHEVNFRANMFAFVTAGVTRIVGTNIVGSLRTDLPPGSIVLPDQFLDFTRGRLATMFDRYGHRHVDVAEPFCPQLRDLIAGSAAGCGIDVTDRVTYVAVEGPRYETRAEVRAYARLGGDVVGMTCATEAILAREIGLCYASVAMVSNLGAGLDSGQLDADSFVAASRNLGDGFRTLVGCAVNAAADVPDEGDEPRCCVPTQAATLPSWRDLMLGLTGTPHGRPVATPGDR